MDTAGGRYKRRLGRRHQDLVQGALSLAQPLDRVNRVNETKTRGFPGNLSLKPWEKRGKGENLGNVRKTWENKLGIPRNWLMKIEEFKGKLRTQEFIYLSIYLSILSLSLPLSLHHHPAGPARLKVRIYRATNARNKMAVQIKWRTST